MKSNLARRIDDTDDPRIPHPMFPRSDGQPESRKIFYIRLFRKRKHDGPIEFCPVRFLASESRDEGWSYFVERFGGGYYRAEATSSANKKQAYTGGSSLRWFHFPGKSKPFPLPGSTVQELPKPSAPTMPNATWNEVRALLRSERRAFAELIEAERKASDERMIAVLARFEKVTREERERMQAMDAMLREERERGKEAEERLIDALNWFEKTARNREDATRDALLRVTEVMRIHAGNEAVRISYDEWRPVDAPKPRKPRKPRLPSTDRKARAPKGKKAKARDEAPSDGHGGFTHPPDLNFAREIGVHFKPEAYRSAVVAHLRRPDAEPPSEQEDESFEPSPAAMTADHTQREESLGDGTQHSETNTADSESKAEGDAGSEATDEAKTASESDTNAKSPSTWELLQRWRGELEQKQGGASTNAVPPTDQAEAEHPHAPQTEAPTSAREGVSEGNDHPSQGSAETPSSDASTACGEAEGSASPFIIALLNAQKRLETHTSEQILNSVQTTRDNVVNGSPSMLEAVSIRVQQRPPINVPEGTTTVRTLHGWVTIPSEWLEPNITDDVRAMLSNLLSQRIPIDTPE